MKEKRFLESLGVVVVVAIVANGFRFRTVTSGENSMML